MDLELLIKTIIKQNNNANTFQLASAQDSVQTSKVMQSRVTFGAPDSTKTSGYFLLFFTKCIQDTIFGNFVLWVE
jgi:hypothetical protein